MSHHEHVKILAFVGLSGTGKSTAVEYFTDQGVPKVYFGSVILNAMKDAGIEINETNERKFREEFREKHGKDEIANRIVQQIHDLINAGQHRIVAESLYTWSEYKVLKHAFPGELLVVATIAPKKLRYRRLENRPVRPLSEEEVRERDWSEIENLEKGGPIAIADYYAVNDGSLEDFHDRLKSIAEDANF